MVKIVYINVETTGSGINDEIIQLSAIDEFGKTFNEYMLPTVRISKRITRINGFYVDRHRLYHDGNFIQTMRRKDFLNSFYEFLLPGPVILVSHNGRCISFPKLIQELNGRNMLYKFQDILQGFCDSLTMARCNITAKRYGLLYLYDALVRPISFDKIYDCYPKALMLKEVCDRSFRNKILTGGIEFTYNLNEQIEAYNLKINKASLTKVFKRLLSTYMIKKMAKAKIDWPKLLLKFKNNGASGVKMLLKNVVRNNSHFSIIINECQRHL